MKNLLVFTALTLVLFSCGDSGHGTIQNVDANRFSVLIDSLNNEQLIDVRTPGEFSNGHIANAQNIDWNSSNFAAEAGKLDKSKPVMVYCLSGGRSSEASDWLKTNGFTSIYQMKNGLRGWQEAHLPLSPAETVQSTPSETETGTASFSSLVNSQTLVLVDFSATWCGPCKRLAPRLDELTQDMPGKFRLLKFDADRDSHLADSMNITALPTLLLYKNGKLVWRNEGLVEKDLIADQIKAAN